MFLNTLKITFRNLKRQKGYSFISIAGLAIGLASSILIYFFVAHELSYDAYHQGGERIYRLPTIVKTGASEKHFARGLTPLIPHLRSEFPEIESATRFHYMRSADVRVEHNGQVFVENSFLITDNDFFKVFTVPFIAGDPAVALERPGTMVITQAAAERIFPNTNPLGRTLTVLSTDYEITGVVENAPQNTHLRYDLLASLQSVEKRMNLNNWGWTGFYSFVKLAPGSDAGSFEGKIRKVAHNFIGENLDALGMEFIVYLQPLRDIHLHSDIHREIKEPGNAAYITVFVVVAILVLLVACINFVNLTTARSLKRAKEVGVRKVLGAQRTQLTHQFMGEFFTMALISLALAMILVAGVLPYFNQLADKQFTLAFFLRPPIVAALACLIVFVGLAACSYPAFLLSGFKPARILQRLSGFGVGTGRLRRVLVVGQFAVSIALIIATLIIQRQIEFMKNQNLGFSIEQKLVVPGYYDDNLEAVKSEFMSSPAIVGATASASIPGRMTNSLVTKIAGDDTREGWTILYNFIDPDFISEYELEVIAGRGFQKENSADEAGAFVINEAAVRHFDFGTPEAAVGRRLARGSLEAPIIGVVRDFHIQGLQSTIPPHILQLSRRNLSLLTLTLQTKNIAEVLSFIESKWQEHRLGDTFTYFFLDDDFERQYRSEERMGRLFAIFTLLGIFVAILGLYGLASYMAEQQTKEIGIRKVLGASVPGLVVLMSKAFAKWILVANCIAWPLAYLSMNSWLQNFAFRIDLTLWIFLGTGVMTILIALLTVGFQALKAAFANPIDSLRYE